MWSNPEPITVNGRRHSKAAHRGQLRNSPANIDQVRDYRSIARALLRADELDRDRRRQALMDLMRAARSEPLAEIICAAIVEEISWQISRDDVVRDMALGDEQERRHRQLRANGLDTCGTCLSPLSTPGDWAYWRELREAAFRELEAKEGAV
jgi:hypothetical protein